MGEGEAAATTAVDAIRALATTVSTQGLEAITAVIPLMAPIIAAGVVVSIGIRWVRRMRG